MPFSLNQTNIDFHDPNFSTLLSSIQGNILKGHGRNHTTNIFVEFKPGKQKEAKKWIADYSEHVTSAGEQLFDTEKFKAKKSTGAPFSTLYISGSGYKYLGLDTSGFDDEFVKGMKDAQGRLKDTPESFWYAGFRGEIHMLILLADNDQMRMANTSKSLLQDLVDEIADIKTVEYGHAIRDANGVGLEHNGYADGISQPLFLKGDISDFENANPKPWVYDPTATLALVLKKDPLATSEEDFGSFFVFRKLEQNVRGFKHEEEVVLVDKLQKAAGAAKPKLHFGNEDGDRAGAMVVGRYEDGSPVTVSKFNNFPDAANFNNFNYDKDKEGAKCPFHAHIRKANPRSGPDDKTHVMARRGIPFGQRDVPTETDPSAEQSPTGGVGLLFMSYQQSLAGQFEFIQSKWINEPNFPQPETQPGGPSGSDPLIGEDPAGDPKKFISKGSFPIEYDNKNPANFTSQEFHSFVKLKGGEYFFAPSLAFLKNINGD
jgi:Dyp-type peroxidase family